MITRYVDEHMPKLQHGGIMSVPVGATYEYMDRNIMLSSLAAGERGTVAGLIAADKERRRLREIGLTDGTWVQCVLRSRAISAFLIKGTVIALRDSDSCCVRINLCTAKGGEKR